MNQEYARFRGHAIRLCLCLYFLFGITTALFSQKASAAQKTGNPEGLSKLLDRARSGLLLDDNTRIYPYVTFENGMDAYGHLAFVHQPVWAPADLLYLHLKYEHGGDYSLGLKYRANSLSFNDNRISFLFRLTNTDARYFYGLGNETLKPDRQRTMLFSLYSAAEIAHAFNERVSLSLTTGYLALQSGLEEGAGFFEKASRAGYVSSRVTFEAGQMSYLSRARQGEVSLFAELDIPVQASAAGFSRIGLQAAARMPVYKQTKLGIQGQMEMLFSNNHEMVPYFALPSVGSRTGLRGFSRDRFRDFSVYAINLEYAVPVSRQFELFGLADFAAAAGSVAELAQSNLHKDFGIGLRFLNDSLPVSVGLAAGNEGLKAFSVVSIRLH